jgi:hypothetical protein
MALCSSHLYPAFCAWISLVLIPEGVRQILTREFRSSQDCTRALDSIAHLAAEK